MTEERKAIEAINQMLKGLSEYKCYEDPELCASGCPFYLGEGQCYHALSRKIMNRLSNIEKLNESL